MMNAKQFIGECQDVQGNLHNITDVQSTPRVDGNQAIFFLLENGNIAIQLEVHAVPETAPVVQNIMVTQEQFAMLFMTFHSSIEKFNIPIEELAKQVATRSGIPTP